MRSALRARQVSVLVATELFGSAHAEDFEGFFVEGGDVGVFERRAEDFFSGGAWGEVSAGFGFPDSGFGLEVRLEVVDVFGFGDGVIVKEEDFFADVFAEFIGPLLVELEVRAAFFEGFLTPGVFEEFFGLGFGFGGGVRSGEWIGGRSG